MAKLNSSLQMFYGRYHDLDNRHGISLSQMTKGMFRLSSSQSVHFLMTRFVTRVAHHVTLEEQELLTFTKHLISSPDVNTDINQMKSKASVKVFDHTNCY